MFALYPAMNMGCCRYLYRETPVLYIIGLYKYVLCPCLSLVLSQTQQTFDITLFIMLQPKDNYTGW